MSNEHKAGFTLSRAYLMQTQCAFGRETTRKRRESFELIFADKSDEATLNPDLVNH